MARLIANAAGIHFLVQGCGILVSMSHAERATSTPLSEIDVSDPRLYAEDTWRGYFERLRAARVKELGSG